ncbi:MAG TPA: phenylalanine--tRNA ligase subunit beta [Candidatus Binataceae bacterium]|nr:phenylalanine--tRNA ligase subunit beta [Candidatus Binataceae bacterium]
MKLPLSWLHEFVTVEADLEELCRRLTMAGLEVEAVDRIEATFSDVFVAKVLGVERHPNADRLNLCEVDAGSAGHFRVVCGAPNVHPGMTAAFARVGARLAGGVHGEGSGNLADAVPLQAAMIRGVQSEGMLCSERELGLSNDHEGIVELDRDARPGEPFENYLKVPDTVLDIAITPNRGDGLSIFGLAREVAALFDAKLKPPRFKPLRISRRNADAPDANGVPLRVDIQAPELCPRYAALVMNEVSLGPTPVWMRRRLELCGMRSLNNVVDVTNYVMLEIGQPLHAFDRAQIADGGIIVRRAGDDREFETLDGIKRTLEPGDLLIADRAKPLAIAGVMGGRNSEVSETTSSIVLESAYFEPMRIARTARRLGLRSEASYRFERGIDRSGQVNAVLRAAELIGALAGGKAAMPPCDVEPHPAAPRRITLDLGSIDSLLGVSLPPPEIKRRLKALGATIEPAGRNRLTVIAPPFRPDINEPADLAEEVARLAGLAEIPAVLPLRSAVAPARNPERTFVRRLREALVGCGLVEAKTIAFIAPAENARYPGLAVASGDGPSVGEPVRVVNPLSTELSEMRLSLLPGLLAALRFNLNREALAMHAFELNRVFVSKDGIPGEARRVAAVSYGDYSMGSVNHPAVQASFFTLKGILEACLSSVGLPSALSFEPAPHAVAPYLHPGRAAQVSLEGRQIGLLGELHPAEALRLEFSAPCVLFELDLANLMSYSSESRRMVQSPPRFPAVRRDVALLVDRDVPAETVLRAVSGLNLPLLESVELFDVYDGGSVPVGKKSVALACRYRSKDRTLTDEEVNRTHGLLVEQAKVRLGAELRL